MSAESAVVAGPQLVATLRNYVSLTKPRVVSLLLVTTVPAMVVAAGGWPGTWLVLATLAGGSLSAGGANAINCWYDRDIDALMSRTRSRPVVTGAVPAAHALGLGVALGAIAFVVLWAWATPLAAALSLVALLFYVFVYTAWLKRRTAQNIVIGGAAGAFPPMVGWAAVSGELHVAAVVMFGIIFLWTPPHFWALSLRLSDDYGRAGVPMLPVTRGAAETRRQILLYTLVLVPFTFVLIPAGDLSWAYAAAAFALGAEFIRRAWLLRRQPALGPLPVYKFSLAYLALLFVAMAVDVALFG